MGSPQPTPRSRAKLLESSLAEGLAAAQQHKIPGLVLWIFGSLLIAGYYLVPSIQSVLENLGEWKRQAKFLFAAFSTGLFGGLLPSLIGKLTSKSTTENHHVVSNSLLWAIKGLEIELLYQLQAFAFGDQPSWTTVTVKTFFDQFIYVPALGLPNVVLFYLWRDCHYNFSLFRNRLGKQWYVRRILPILVSNWLIWIPAVILIYCFPQALQLPVQNLILCFWVLILTLLAGSTNRDNDDFVQ